jgi:hypothetical protein
MSVAKTSDGGYAIAGYTNSSFASGGGYDAYLIKTDSYGNVTWGKTYGGSGGDYGESVIQTSDGGFAIAGYTNSFGAGGLDVYLVKTDLSGNLMWNRTYGYAGTDVASSVVQTSDGGYVIAGYTSSFGQGGDDVYLVKTNASGNVMWDWAYGGSGYDIGASVIQSSDGGFAIVGYTNSSFSSGGGYDVYLVKTNSTGNFMWSKTYGYSGTDIGFSVIQTSDGGFAIAGYTSSFGNGGYDFYLVKTDVSGTMIWAWAYGGTGNDIGEWVVQTSDAGYAIVGHTASFGAGGDDVYLVKTNSTGNFMWDRSYGYAGTDIGSSVVQTSDGGYAIAGNTNSFGSGGYDIYFIKTDLNGN